MSRSIPPEDAGTARTRRERGSGSYTWDASKRRYKVRFPLGEGRRVTVYVKTDKLAERELRRLAAEHAAGRLVTSRLTLNDWVVEWLADHVLPNRAHRTYEAYRSKLELHVLPTLGAIRLAKLEPRHLRQLYATLTRPADKGGAGLSPNTVRTIHAALHSRVKRAVRDRHVGHNVCDLVDAPTAVDFEPSPLDEAQARTLLEAIRGHRHENLWRFMLWTGARFGEAAGLGWGYVDEGRHEARLWWGLARVPPALRDDPAVWWELKSPKRAASRRTVPLTLPALAALRDQAREVEGLKAAAGSAWADPMLPDSRPHPLVFPDWDGLPLHETTVQKRWRALLKGVGLPEEARMHDVRHTTAGFALDAGAELIDVSRLLGHANTTVTDKIYAGRLAKSTRRAAERVAETLVPRYATHPSEARSVPDSVP